jgi:hypothetical protein
MRNIMRSRLTKAATVASLALALGAGGAFADPLTTQPNAVGGIVSPCGANVPLLGNGASVPVKCGGAALAPSATTDTTTQANVAFTGLPAAAAVADADTLPVNQGAGNLKQTFAAIKTWIKGWIAKADVGLGDVPNVDATNASNISGGTLATARGGVNLGAWTNYTCTAVAETPGGTPPVFTINSCSYWQNGKTITARADVTVNAQGTGSGGIIISLPFTAAAFKYAGSSMEYVVTGLGGACLIFAPGTTMYCLGSTPYIVTGRAIVAQIQYAVP